MGDRLAGKVAIITGASKGIGAADARLFAAEGAQLVLTDVDVGAGEALAAELGPDTLFVRHDVRFETEWQKVIALAEERFGKVDILVNNAGVANPGTPESFREEDYRFNLAVNVDGVVFGCKHAIAAMRRAGGGSIVNMSSISAARGEPNMAIYSATKGAVDAYSRTVAVYCAQLGLPIRCNSVLPNGISTPMIDSLPEKYAQVGADTLLKGVPSAANLRGEPQDVAYLVLYLASDESRWVSGQSILIDNSAGATKGYVPPAVVPGTAATTD
ncbi:MAG: oxidoreductase, short-chain dehydrogenase/reductase family [Sphingomonas bacterium]|jgi:3(or 17)beta-hydroxysteroid dehydrogenase|uniref:SDR family oxidoreductase n=1 Tax=Sphingomonas bacterium TaxID=1895847 RepID=UPI00260A5684|nr:SDR family oxidoreductase [Sphingomonas bacterium]MDB5703852.1 oxidoreductase, short-chain dehydrogenase/reductase family [Sphingomonas bacterium]